MTARDDALQYRKDPLAFAVIQEEGWSSLPPRGDVVEGARECDPHRLEKTPGTFSCLSDS